MDNSNNSQSLPNMNSENLNPSFILHNSNIIDEFVNQISSIFDNIENNHPNQIFMPRLMPLRPQSLVHFLNQPQTNNVPTMSQIIEQSFNEKSKFKNIVSDEGLTQIEDVEYKIDNSGNYEYTSCPITTDDFEDGDILKKLPCGHIFTSEGILTWFKESNKCPLCRYEMPSTEVKEESIQSNQSTTLNTESLQPPQHGYTSDDDMGSDTDTDSDSDEYNDSQAYQTRQLYNILNTYRSPYSMLTNRRIVPHSYIETIMSNQIMRDEEEMIQQALYNSLQESMNSSDSQQENNNPDISNNQ